MYYSLAINFIIFLSFILTVLTSDCVEEYLLPLNTSNALHYNPYLFDQM